MTDITKLAQLPTSLHVEEIAASGPEVHESLFRSHHLLTAVKGWLKRGLAADVILNYIALIEANGERRG